MFQYALCTAECMPHGAISTAAPLPAEMGTCVLGLLWHMLYSRRHLFVDQLLEQLGGQRLGALDGEAEGAVPHQ